MRPLLDVNLANFILEIQSFINYLWFKGLLKEKQQISWQSRMTFEKHQKKHTCRWVFWFFFLSGIFLGGVFNANPDSVTVSDK